MGDMAARRVNRLQLKGGFRCHLVTTRASGTKDIRDSDSVWGYLFCILFPRVEGNETEVPNTLPGGCTKAAATRFGIHGVLLLAP